MSSSKPTHMSDPIFDARVTRALDNLRDEGDALRIIQRLRADLPDELARRAAELHRLRIKARAKFPRHAPPYMTTKGYAQATPEAVADARAAHIHTIDPTAWVADRTCGIGADSLALARRGQKGVACDIDAYHLACTRANLIAAGFPARVVRAEASRPVVDADFLLIDPDRRVGGRRSLDPEQASPPLSVVLALVARQRGACVKLAPGLDPRRMSPDPLQGAAFGLEWVSLRGELVELSLWTGELVPDGAQRRATRLDGAGGRAVFEGLPELTEALPADAVPAVIADPDPALVRSGLLGALARAEGLAPLDPQLAYLGGERVPESRLVTPYRVLGSAALDRRRLRRVLAEHDVGSLQVLKRGHPDTAEALARRYRGPGQRHGQLLVARIGRGHRAFLVERLERSDPEKPVDPGPDPSPGADGGR